MKTKNILLITRENNSRVQRLEEMLSGTYNIIRAHGAANGLKVLEKWQEGIFAAIVDNPSQMTEMDELTTYLHEWNSYLHSIPILILTDNANQAADEEYINDPVIGVIEEGQSARVVLTRIEKAAVAINSITFSEFAWMLKALPSLIYLKDPQGRYVFCSQYLHHLENYDDPDWTIRGKTDLEIRKDQKNARAAYESDLRIVATGKGTSYVIEENEDGQQEFLQLIKEPLKGEDGKVKGIIAIINNVTEQENLRRELQKKSVTDELTGLYNRVYLDEFLGILSEDCFPMTVFSADCDNLKFINDHYGHLVGDEYIRMAVNLFKTTLPERAVMFRSGGDEFIIFVPNMDRREAQEHMDALRDMEKKYRIRDHELSVSFGFSTMEYFGDNLKENMERSDEEMYRDKKAKKAKKQGR